MRPEHFHTDHYMLNWRPIAATLIMLLGGIPSAHGEEPIHRIAPGITASVKLFRGTETGLKIPFHMIEIHRSAGALRILDARRADRDRASVEALATESGALAAINGSFFLDDGTPLGLRISQGQRLSPLRKVDWGVFSIDQSGHPDLVHVRDWKDRPEIRFAFQSGPRLVVAGKALTFKPNIARRSAICVRKDDTILLVATARPLTLLELATLLQRSKSNGGMACEHALNLDGGSSTQITIPGAPRALGIRDADSVPIAIGVFPPG
jgi:hypothetical protein